MGDPRGLRKDSGVDMLSSANESDFVNIPSYEATTSLVLRR